MRFVSVILLSVSLLWAQETYQDYLKNEQQSFQKYVEETNREFEEYKKAFMEEYTKYKEDVKKHWGVFEDTDRKKWVQYANDYKTKRVFNFETGELRIEIAKEVKNPSEVIKKELKDFLTEDKREAFQRDPVASGVEKKIKKGLKHVKTDSIEREPILAPIVLGKSKYTQSELNGAISKLIKKGKMVIKKDGEDGRIVFQVKIPPKHVLQKAKQYKPIVEQESNKRRLSPPLVFAIIHTESSFNPMARSPIPAYGLMQIVPCTAGKDAAKIVYGKPMVLSPSFLYNAKNNITIGTAYIYLLYYKYLKGIKDPESRLYCTIAAYNTGVKNVASAFTKSRSLEKAIRIINKMNSKDVYDTLIKNLPYQETRDYLKKVTSRIAVYENM